MKRQSPTLRERATLGLQRHERIKHSDRSGGRTVYPGRYKRSGPGPGAYTLSDFAYHQCPFCEVFYWKRRGSNRVTCYKNPCQQFQAALSVISETIAVDPERPTTRRRHTRLAEDENEAWARCYYVGLNMPYFVEADGRTDPFLNAAWIALEDLGLRVPKDRGIGHVWPLGRMWRDPWLNRKH